MADEYYHSIIREGSEDAVEILSHKLKRLSIAATALFEDWTMENVGADSAICVKSDAFWELREALKEVNS